MRVGVKIEGRTYLAVHFAESIETGMTGTDLTPVMDFVSGDVLFLDLFVAIIFPKKRDCFSQSRVW